MNNLYTNKFLSYNHHKNSILLFNKYYNEYYNENKTNIESLIDIFYNKIMTVNHNIHFDNYLIHSISYEPLYHKYPIQYEYYITNIDNNVDYITFNQMINLRQIDLYNIIDYTPFIQKYIKNNHNNQLIEGLNLLHNGIFISLDIKLYVENNMNKLVIYSFDHLDLYIYYNDQILNTTILNDLIKHIVVISQFIYNLNPINRIKFLYFDTLIEKQLINDNNYICSQNINSGLSSGEYIIIWRREELPKVLIHELIHYLNIDIKHNNNLKSIINYNIGQYDYPILINESITEIQAQFIHTIYILVSNKTPLIEVFKLFKIFYYLEHLFSWYQLSKIMNYFNIVSFDDQLIKLNFNQTSNAFSYYILKPIIGLRFFDILFELRYIKKLMNDNNKCQIINIIKTCIHNKPLIMINQMITELKYDSNSLRMTIFGYY